MIKGLYSGSRAFVLNPYSNLSPSLLCVKCLKKVLTISYLEHRTSDWERSNINFLMGQQEPFLLTLKRRKLEWFGHVTRAETTSPETSFRVPRSVGDAVLGREHAEWTTSKSGHPCPYDGLPWK